MNDLTVANFNTAVSMTSREIADLTGKRHDHVLRDIRTMLAQMYDLEATPSLGYQPIQGVTIEHDPQTKRIAQISLDKNHTLNLVTGYDPVIRMRIIQRWQELEASHATPQTMLPSTKAKHVFSDYLDVAKLLDVPMHIGQQEAVKEARNQAGVDYSPLLTHAPAQSDIADEDVYLEPTDLGKRYGLSGREFNKWLQAKGLQYKDKGEWIPTESGERLCKRHAWTAGAKSGYNLKWNAKAIEEMMQ